MRPVILAAVLSLTACAGVLSFLDAHGRDVAEAVLACVPESDKPTKEDAAACVDAALGTLESTAGQTDGELVLDCAEALRAAAAGDAYAEARARALVERVEGGR